MRRSSYVIAGLALAVTPIGCSESPPESGPVPYKATSSPAIDALRDQMSKNAKGATYSKKQEPEPKPGTAKAADSAKAAPATKEEPKKP